MKNRKVPKAKPKGIRPSEIIPAIDRIEAVVSTAEAQLMAVKQRAHALLDEAEQHIAQLSFSLNRARRRLS